MNDSSLQNETWAARTWKSPVVQKVGPFLFFAGLFLLFFSPVLLSGRLLAPQDGVNFALPNFYAPRSLWTPLLFSGYPIAADPQTQTWYPLSLLFSLIPDGWNLFMVSGYTLAAWFMFGYVRTVTGSQMSGLVSGMAYGLSGFLVGRIVHVPLIHAAIWLPLLFWALEKTRVQPSAGWSVIGSLAIACSFLGGHTQIIFYGLIVAGAYVLYLGWHPGERRWNYYSRFVLMVILGIGLVAIQILPTLELAEWSARKELTYEKFIQFSMTFPETLTLFFPYLFGGGGILNGKAYFGSSNGIEVPGYLGLLTLMLGGVAVAGYRSKRIVKFWLAVAVTGLILAWGDHTPLSKVMFHIPGFNKFRIPVRHYLEITLAASVLAGWGAQVLLERRIRSRPFYLVLVGFAGVFLLALGGIFFHADFFLETAARNRVEYPDFISLHNPALWLPLVCLAVSAGSLFNLWLRPDRALNQVWVLVVLVMDLGLGGGFNLWKTPLPHKDWFQPPPYTEQFKTVLNASHQRLTPLRGLHSQRDQYPTNLSRLWGIPNANGYNPLVLARMNDLLSRFDSGALGTTWSSVRHRGLDLLAVRFMLFDKRYQGPLDQEGLDWPEGTLGLRLGSGCGQSYPASAEFMFAKGLNVSEMEWTGTNRCAPEIPEGQTILTFRLSGESGKRQDIPVKMERDIAEDDECRGTGDRANPSQAGAIVEPSEDPQGASCRRFKDSATLPVKNRGPVRRMNIESTGRPGIVELDQIIFRDAASGKRFPFLEVTNSGHWQYKAGFGDTVVYENRDAMPRAWLVPEVIPASAEQILRAVEYAALPDGRPFHPAQVALVEEGEGRTIESFDPRGTVEILELKDTGMVLQSRSGSESFLVVSDIFYPGWEATIDGTPAPVFQTDYVLRGVWLPAGTHEIRFQYHPTPFYWGLGLTLASMVLLVLWRFNLLPLRQPSADS